MGLCGPLPCLARVFLASVINFLVCFKALKHSSYSTQSASSVFMSTACGGYLQSFRYSPSLKTYFKSVSRLTRHNPYSPSERIDGKQWKGDDQHTLVRHLSFFLILISLKLADAIGSPSAAKVYTRTRRTCIAARSACKLVAFVIPFVYASTSLQTLVHRIFDDLLYA
ncbi:hypothetical protein C8R44DRAFT_824662 [Mycena epipterygia]|nr:hypothetical protein C8R44DRAFT_824662 [Mycena epipterygia]